MSDTESPEAPSEERIAERVQAVDGVELHAGALGEITTYVQKERVAGVRLSDDNQRVELHLAITWGENAAEVAKRVRDAVKDVFPGEVDVFVDDINEPAES